MTENLSINNQYLHLKQHLDDSTSTQATEEKVMMLPAVTTVQEMGYSEEKIKTTIHTIKSRSPRGRAVGQRNVKMNSCDIFGVYKRWCGTLYDIKSMKIYHYFKFINILKVSKFYKIDKIMLFILSHKVKNCDHAC